MLQAHEWMIARALSIIDQSFLIAIIYEERHLLKGSNTGLRMETSYKGRKIVSEARESGTSWLVETVIWPGLSDDAEEPRIMRTIGAPGQSEYEAQKMALETLQKLIDDGYL